MADAKLDWVNEADVDELAAIEGIGRNRAEGIINEREKNGAFKSWDDLKKVPGMNDEMIEKLKQGE